MLLRSFQWLRTFSDKGRALERTSSGVGNEEGNGIPPGLPDPSCSYKALGSLDFRASSSSSSESSYARSFMIWSHTRWPYSRSMLYRLMMITREGGDWKAYLILQNTSLTHLERGKGGYVLQPAMAVCTLIATVGTVTSDSCGMERSKR